MDLLFGHRLNPALPLPLYQSSPIFSGHPQLQTSTYLQAHSESRTLHDAVNRVETDNA